MKQKNIAPENTPINPEIVKILIDDYGKGNLLFQRSENHYLGQPPAIGCVWYFIYYETKESGLIYSGAYQIRKPAEEELIKREQLPLFLMTELSKQLSF